MEKKGSYTLAGGERRNMSHIIPLYWQGFISSVLMSCNEWWFEHGYCLNVPVISESLIDTCEHADSPPKLIHYSGPNDREETLEALLLK